MRTADLRAALAREWDHGSDWPPVVLLTDHPAAGEGRCVWRVLGGTASTVLPALRPDAPPSVHRRYLARVTANLTGRCPLCGQVAGMSADPERTPAAWSVTRLTVAIRHDPACGATFTDADRRWFPSITGEAR